MHSPVEIADVEDIERAVQLIVSFALKLDSGLDLAG
jgi:putative aminopeptidase FrvX